jgi:hypothetical protein
MAPNSLVWCINLQWSFWCHLSLFSEMLLRYGLHKFLQRPHSIWYFLLINLLIFSSDIFFSLTFLKYPSFGYQLDKSSLWESTQNLPHSFHLSLYLEVRQIGYCPLQVSRKCRFPILVFYYRTVTLKVLVTFLSILQRQRNGL